MSLLHPFHQVLFGGGRESMGVMVPPKKHKTPTTTGLRKEGLNTVISGL